jgi:hypothetical protein
MISAAQFRKLALAFPEVEEKSHFEQPDFRVRNKIFAGLSQDHAQGTLKLTPELQAMVMSAEPDVFIPAAGAWGRSGWTRIVLAKAELPGLRELLTESYRLVAPKVLASRIDPEHALQDAVPELEAAAAPKRKGKGKGSRGQAKRQGRSVSGSKSVSQLRPMENVAPAPSPQPRKRKTTKQDPVPEPQPRKRKASKKKPPPQARKRQARK